MKHLTRALTVALLALPLHASGDELPQDGDLPWTPRHARHLLNRAGFGATPAELDAALRMGPERVVRLLIEGGREVEPTFFATIGVGDFGGVTGKSPAEQREVRRKVRDRDKAQLAEYTRWWIQRMVNGDDPLRDRMTLFWHGFFTTSSKELRRTYEVMQQHQLLRNNAIGSYATLLEGIVHDPAMYYYLDNNENKKGSPNENLARELLELFSLGEGNYSEKDIRQVARALTGHRTSREGAFQFKANQHDKGQKTIFGQKGRFKAEDVARILLEQEACAEWVAGRLVEYFEGEWPTPERHEEYADFLRDHDYALAPFLEKLFLDPRFYRDEVVGTRIASPIDYLVAAQRRLRITVDPEFTCQAAGELGERLFQPPNVKGWEGGEAWITTGSLFGRANAVGMMLDVLDTRSALVEAMDEPSGEDMEGASMDSMDSMDSMGESMGESMDMAAGMDEESSRGPRLPSGLRKMEKALGRNYAPQLNLTWRFSRADARTDRELADALLDGLLAIDAPESTRRALAGRLAADREALEIEEGELFEHAVVCEDLLRRLAHLVLSLPEAQLH